jgi:uncharacterized protein (TIGR00730 family)
MPAEANPYRVVVYCASAPGTDPAYLASATQLGKALADSGMSLVYGGATVGLMGAVANAALDAGAEVIGILPEVLKSREVAHLSLTRLEYTATMHQRKARMIELADAVIALPGGFGTLDELMEAVTWAQLGIHTMPCIVVNILGYYDGLLKFLDTAVDAGFLKPANRQRLLIAATVEEAIHILNQQRTL